MSRAAPCTGHTHTHTRTHTDNNYVHVFKLRSGYARVCRLDTSLHLSNCDSKCTPSDTLVHVPLTEALMLMCRPWTKGDGDGDGVGSGPLWSKWMEVLASRTPWGRGGLKGPGAFSVHQGGHVSARALWFTFRTFSTATAAAAASYTSLSNPSCSLPLGNALPR